MKLPTMIKFIIISAVVYQILSLKPVKKALLGFVISAGASYLRNKLKI